MPRVRGATLVRDISVLVTNYRLGDAPFEADGLHGLAGGLLGLSAAGLGARGRALGKGRR